MAVEDGFRRLARVDDAGSDAERPGRGRHQERGRFDVAVEPPAGGELVLDQPVRGRRIGHAQSASASTISASPSLVESEKAFRKSSTPPRPPAFRRIASTRRRARASIRPSAARSRAAPQEGSRSNPRRAEQSTPGRSAGSCRDRSWRSSPGQDFIIADADIACKSRAVTTLRFNFFRRTRPARYGLSMSMQVRRAPAPNSATPECDPRTAHAAFAPRMA